MVHNIRITFGAQIQPQIEVQQGDYNSRTIQALCYTSSGSLMGFEGNTASVVYEIAGNPSEEYPVKVLGSVLTFTMPGLVSSSAGAGKLQLRIYGEESLLHSAVIPYTVKASIEPGQGEEDQVPMLVLLVQQAQEAIAGANEAASTANQAAGSANSAANSANEKAGIAASAANSAKEAASNAATMASLAQTATANANSAANSASNAAESANQAAASANAAAASASQVAADVQQKADSGAFNGKNGLDAPQINDTQITTTNPWSSMQIVKTLCPPFTVSGATVQCTPVANYPLGVQVEITPTQEGTGDPSPENVRPIVGWDAVNIHQSNGDQDNTYTVQLGQTVYGGTLDVGTGVGSEEWFTAILTGNETWNAWGANYPNSFFTDIEGHKNLANDAINVFCSNFSFDIMDGRYTPYHFFSQNPGAFPDRVRLCFTFDETVTNIDLAKQWISAQYTSGTPVTICYRLATPTPIQATGGQSIPALSGTNTLFADAGDITVTGASDPIATITALQNRVSALESAQTNM